MTGTILRHAILGEITRDMTDDLAKIAVGATHQSYVGGYSSAQLAVLKDIASLQVKATRTFGKSRSEVWWVTRRGLQQSTLAAVADFKATWFGDEVVLDVCCGLGSDLIALAKRGPTTGVDLDEDVLAFAAGNLRGGGASAELRHADVMTTPVDQLVGEARFVHVDPDRRVDGKRHTRCDDLVPDWDRLDAILRRCRGGVIKMAPATSLNPEQADSFHRMWIGAGGSVREQTLLQGDVLDHPWIRRFNLIAGTRSAVCLRGGTTHVFAGAEPSSEPSAETTAPSRRQVGEFLIDPDAAIRAAGLTEAFAEHVHAAPVDQFNGFLTADDVEHLPSEWPMATTARVLEVIGCDQRKLRRCFRARNAYPEVIKVRGADQDPAVLHKTLRSCGDHPLGLWIGRNGKQVFAAITERSR
ncbi:hypothetical protein Pla100_27750 [Neorhodopirellula pilleata]|uniref:Methyltransferase domain-containing protein n=1 Tax=Neorhodopirellula pilleata TaxID=2714738 RepID=A0A5C6AAF9_9BACT|nr:hypothetical protein Pla100_27750 [Neorhodopirellula pilleata]